MRLEDAPMKPRRGESLGVTWRVETLRLSRGMSPRQYSLGRPSILTAYASGKLVDHHASL